MSIIMDEYLNKDRIKEAIQFSLKKIDFAKETFKTTFPDHASVDNVYPETENVKGWNQGFWTGILWIAYELTGNEEYRKAAEMQIPTYTKRVVEELTVDHHDMGFLYTPSCVAAYKLTGNEEAKKAALMAADFLMVRYHEKGEFIQAWGKLDDPDNYRLIIDCLLNIPLLYWASEVSGDKKYDETALKHFNTTAAHIMRENGSTYHTFYFDPETGKPLKGVTAQGASDDSCWARGQAWGIYGMMLTYKYHKSDIAMERFKKITDYYISLLPQDYVPFWDMIFGDGSGEPRDSSAAAIAVCGILEAVKYMQGEEKEKYLAYANKVMASLINDYLCWGNDKCNGLLLHASYAVPQNAGVDECNIWGDYFFMEALIRFVTENKWELYW